MTAKAKWTFIVYMGGDNSNLSASDATLNELRRIGSTPEVNVLVQRDRAGDQGTQRFLIQQSGNDMAQSLGETNSGDPDVLIDFVSWVSTHYPADHYALILWNQGGGWKRSHLDMIAQAVAARSYNVREAAERAESPLRHAFFRHTLETILGQNSPQERAVCASDGSGYALDILELGRTLRKIQKMLRQPLDLLGLDASLPCSLEVAYEVKSFVSYLLASEKSSPEAWPYEKILSKVVADPNLLVSDFANHIVDVYLQYYQSAKSNREVSQTALDLAKIERVIAPLDDLTNLLITQMPKIQTKLWTAQRKAVRFFDTTLWDIADLCAELAKLTTNKAIRGSTAAVQASLQAGVGSFVISTAHQGPFVERCGGVSIYLPPLMAVSPYYQDLEFAKEHQWLRMLHAYQAG